MSELYPFDKEKILNMDYETMLRMWRFSNGGHKYFHGELGYFFATEMATKKAQLSHDEKIAISKRVGFTAPKNQFGETNA